MYRLLLIFLFTLFSACLTAGETVTKPSVAVGHSVVKPSASIRYMDSIYLTRPHLALQMLDSLRRWSEVNGYHAPATRIYVNVVSCLASIVVSQMRPARYYAQEAVAAARAERHPQYELMMIAQLCFISEYLGDESKLAYWAQELEQRNAKTLHSPWYKASSSIYYAHSLRKRGEFSLALQVLEENFRNLDQMESMSIVMEFKLTQAAVPLLEALKRYDDAIALLERSIRHTEQAGTSRTLDEQGRALNLLGYYESLMNQYLVTGRAQQADHYYRLYQELSARFNGLERNNQYPGKYLMQAHRYSEAEAYARNRLAAGFLQQSDSISQFAKDCMTLLADACLAQDKQAEAATFYRRALTVSDSLTMRERKQAYMEYSLMSELGSNEDTIRQQKSELQRQQLTLAFSGVLALLVLLVICMGIRLIRRQRRFNRELQEENRLKQQSEDELIRLKALMQDRTQSATVASAEDTPEDIAASLKALDEWLAEENRFTQPDLDIEKAARHSGVNKRELAERCMKYKEEPFSEYLAELRLAYSCQRLMDEDFPTIETVAQESGFASVSTYLRRFKTKYEMSPTDWRNLKKEMGGE